MQHHRNVAMCVVGIGSYNGWLGWWVYPVELSSLMNGVDVTVALMDG